MGDLSGFAARLNDKLFNVKILVGLERGNLKPGKVKQHVRNYQLFDNVVWIRRTDTGEMVPIIGGNAAYFLKHFACGRDDMPFEQSKLQALINGGIWNGNKKTQEYDVPNKKFGWMRCDCAPDHATLFDWSSPLIWRRVTHDITA